LIALSFAYVFDSVVTLVIMCVGFVLMMRVGKHFGLLASVHGVKRVSIGDILHPAAMLVTFVAAKAIGRPDFYIISVLVLSISDALAALIGTSYGFKVYRVEEEKKSLEGSLVFMLSTFLIVHIGLLLLTPTERLECVLIALLIAVLVTCFEAISLGGVDNFFIPLGTMFILERLSTASIQEIILRICVLTVMYVLAAALGSFSRRLGSSGILGLGLMGYASWTMASPEWYVPVLWCSLLLCVSDFFLDLPGGEDEYLRIRPVFYMFAAATFWVCFAVVVPEWARPQMFTPFLVSILAILSIRWEWHQRSPRLSFLGPIERRVRHFGRGARAVALTLLFLPWHIFLGSAAPAPWWSLASCIVAVYVASDLYWRIGDRYHGVWTRLGFLRMGLAVDLIVTGILYELNGFFFLG
jgi:hypothetical protein